MDAAEHRDGQPGVDREPLHHVLVHVGPHQPVPRRQGRQHLVPHGHGLRVSVQQQERRALPRRPAVQAHASAFHGEGGVCFEHGTGFIGSSVNGLCLDYSRLSNNAKALTTLETQALP